MQALLSLDEAPPISAPFRFFLTAPLFGMLAGALLLYSGPDLYASRWTPAALALTHLMTAGFMLQVMFGAMLQLLPVVAGANMAHPLRVAIWVHAAITPGGLFLAAAFLSGRPWLYGLAMLLLGAGGLIFVVAAVRALWGVPATSAVIRGLQLVLVGLGATLLLGLLLAAGLGGMLALPLVQLANVHMGWGFVAWGCALLGAVGFVVVPMFQQTPDYPAWFGRAFSVTALAVVLLWSGAELLQWPLTAQWLSFAVVLTAALFAGVTFHLQRRSRRTGLDATQRLWQLGMLSALAACALWTLARLWPAIDQWPRWPLLFGSLLLFGGFMSVIVGMLDKIVPFLVWLHLRNRGGGRIKTPNMKKVLSEQAIGRQMKAHFWACALLVLAACWPAGFVYPAGAALVVANIWLLGNLLSAVRVYRQHLEKIEALTDTRAA